MKDTNNEDVRTWEESFSVEFRKCPYCGANWCREFVDNIFVKFCPACGTRVFQFKDVKKTTN